LQEFSHHKDLQNYDFVKYIKKANEYIKSHYLWAKRKPTRVGIGRVIAQVVINFLGEFKKNRKRITVYAFNSGMCTELVELMTLYNSIKGFEHPPLIVLGFNMY